MEMRSRLFQMMKSGDASQAGFPWFMVGFAARGRPARHAVAWQAGTALAIFSVALIAAIWGWGFRSGAYSLAFAATATVLVAGIAVAAMIRLACVRMASLPPPRRDQSRKMR